MNHHPITLTLALIAHDRRKEALADWALNHRAALRGFALVATRGTGVLVQRRTRPPVRLLESGLAGGDTRIGKLTHDNEVHAVVFFRDPIGAGPHEPDFAGLLRVCDFHEIPLATNAATAEALLYFLGSSPDRGIIAARAWGRVEPLPDGELVPDGLITSDLQLMGHG